MSETTAIATVQRHPARAVALRETMTQDAEQRAVLGEYIRSQMVEGEDYGVLPGTNSDPSKGAVRKVLFKPGAEKLIGLFRCVPKFVVDASVENWDTGLFHYRVTCNIVLQDDETVVVASGLGSCSTYESKYRWRNADRACPNCGGAFIKKSRFADQGQDQPGWYCFAKIGGCGAKYDHDDPAIVTQTTGRVQNPDILDTVNTVLKMAKKRAAVDAALSLSRCSDIFTQDVGDDEAEERRPEPTRQQQKPASPPPPPPPPKPDPAAVAQRVNEFIDGLAAVAATGDLDRIAELAADANGDAVLKGAPSASRERLRLAFAEARETAQRIAVPAQTDAPEQPTEPVPDAEYTPAG